jgi:RNA polymerase sigma-70 factor (ECF subfamily)
MAIAANSDTATAQLFEELFEREASYVWNTLRRLGVPSSDREDILQEVFVRVHGALSSYDPKRSPRPWLFAFAFRVASDYRRLKRHAVEVLDGTEHDAANPTAGPDDSLDGARRRARLHRALDALDIDKRAVVILHEIEELPVPEIARMLGIPVGTASTRLRAARLALAAALRADLGEKGGER